MTLLRSVGGVANRIVHGDQQECCETVVYKEAQRVDFLIPMTINRDDFKLKYCFRH